MNEISIIDKDTIKNKIYNIRGKQVILDSDIAFLYGVETKRINEAVKNNLEKFPERFSWILNKNEINIISRTKFSTLNKSGNSRGNNIKYLPRVFTEQGVALLATILKSKKAVQTSISIMDAFVEMRHFLNDNNLISQTKINDLVLENTNDIKNIKDTMATKEDISYILDNFIDKNKYKEFLILNGENIEAKIAYNMIYNLAKEKIYIIDNYVNIKTLYMLKEIINKEIIIFTNNKYLKQYEIDEYKKEYPKVNIKFKEINNIHDRYIIIDYNLKTERIFLSGSSIKDMGKKISTITEIEDKQIYHKFIDEILKKN